MHLFCLFLFSSVLSTPSLRARRVEYAPWGLARICSASDRVFANHSPYLYVESDIPVDIYIVNLGHETHNSLYVLPIIELTPITDTLTRPIQHIQQGAASFGVIASIPFGVAKNAQVISARIALSEQGELSAQSIITQLMRVEESMLTRNNRAVVHIAFSILRIKDSSLITYLSGMLSRGILLVLPTEIDACQDLPLPLTDLIITGVLRGHFAPGERIATLLPNSHVTVQVSGAVIASAHVAGTLALLLSRKEIQFTNSREAKHYLHAIGTRFPVRERAVTGHVDPRILFTGSIDPIISTTAYQHTSHDIVENAMLMSQYFLDGVLFDVPRGKGESDSSDTRVRGLSEGKSLGSGSERVMVGSDGSMQQLDRVESVTWPVEANNKLQVKKGGRGRAVTTVRRYKTMEVTKILADSQAILQESALVQHVQPVQDYNYLIPHANVLPTEPTEQLVNTPHTHLQALTRASSKRKIESTKKDPSMLYLEDSDVLKEPLQKHKIGGRRLAKKPFREFVVPKDEPYDYAAQTVTVEEPAALFTQTEELPKLELYSRLQPEEEVLIAPRQRNTQVLDLGSHDPVFIPEPFDRSNPFFDGLLEDTFDENTFARGGNMFDFDEEAGLEGDLKMKLEPEGDGFNTNTMEDVFQLD